MTSANANAACGLAVFRCGSQTELGNHSGGTFFASARPRAFYETSDMILPVLDLMQGQIVRGIAGRRDEYRPIVGRLINSAAPLAVAGAFRTYFGFDEFYLADLDAIQDGQPAFEVYDRLQREGFRLWIDAGIRTGHDDALASLLESDAAGIIVGLESVAGPSELREIVQLAGARRSVFSLDLKAGRPLGRADLWHTDDPRTIAEHAVETLGVRRLIVLDLARVGVGEGVGTEDLCMRLKRTYPEVQITAGGGVRGMDDVRRLHANGVDYVLIASALHDGRITPDGVKRL
jgi:phosphoribosylformimino-5-aminoimidazole carboxamide ribotide isomerase